MPLPPLPAAPIKTELTKQKTIDFAKVALELEKQNDRENTFDLLADLDFSAPPPSTETKPVDNAVNWDSTLEAKELVRFFVIFYWSEKRSKKSNFCHVWRFRVPFGCQHLRWYVP